VDKLKEQINDLKKQLKLKKEKTDRMNRAKEEILNKAKVLSAFKKPLPKQPLPKQPLPKQSNTSSRPRINPLLLKNLQSTNKNNTDIDVFMKALDNAEQSVNKSQVSVSTNSSTAMKDVINSSKNVSVASARLNAIQNKINNNNIQIASAIGFVSGELFSRHHV
jgi:hypothetical protein